MVFMSYYESLAEQRDVNTLLWFGAYDERVYDVIEKAGLINETFKLLPSPLASRFLARGQCYDAYASASLEHFISITSMLARYEGAVTGSNLADLLGCCGMSEKNHVELFNFSETYRHLILSRNYFAQRAVLRLLSHVFADDFLQDAVAVLQYKSDILNHINRIFVDTPDFVAWRFSVRAMSLAGGYNEDKDEVMKTERFTSILTKGIPEFLFFFGTAFAWGMWRYYPKRVHGQIPRWLRRRRAVWLGFVSGCLGVFNNSLLDWRMMQHRQEYDKRYHQEQRRRRGAKRSGLPYDSNPYFDNLEGVTRRLWTMQLSHMGATGTLLAFSCMPLPKINFPKFMGDVVFRHPSLPNLFPQVVGLPCTSRYAIPYLIAPFSVATAVTSFWGHGMPLYDYYIHCRWLWYRKYRSVESIEML